jgi:Flp pilus assembly protein TadD/ferredoxin
MNAGFIFLAVALLATLIFGRFVCGWGCHVVAYQDLCAWLLKKIRIKPKPFRSRILVLAPLALALYMFAWPTVYRWMVGYPTPTMSNHLMTTEFWKTFPGAGIAVLTVVMCGFVIVYLLGAKGFCTYGCPYGGLFAVVDKVAAGRILVTDDCEHCGHCTATCTSNVRVHEEVALYGMVVDPGCMKCMDCISVCPNDALYFGFIAPPILNRANQSRDRKGADQIMPVGQSRVASAPRSDKIVAKPTPYDFKLWEEIVMAVVGVGALLIFRGLYGQIPLLLAMGMAAITGFLALKTVRVVRDANVRMQNLQLKRGGRLTRSGLAFAAVTVVLFVFTAHSAAVQYNVWRGRTLFTSLDIGDQVWFPGNGWWENASPDQRTRVEDAIVRYERADRLGLTATATVLQDLTWLHLARGKLDAAEATVRRLIELTPKQPEVHRGLAGVLRKAGRLEEAEAQYRETLRLDPAHSSARTDLAAMLASAGRQEEAIALYREAVQVSPNDTDSRYALALALLSRAGQQTRRSDIDEAIQHLQRVVTDRPTFAEAHYNLGVAVFMSGRPADALPHVRESIRLNLNDPQSREFLAFIEKQVSAPDAP